MLSRDGLLSLSGLFPLQRQCTMAFMKTCHWLRRFGSCSSCAVPHKFMIFHQGGFLGFELLTEIWASIGPGMCRLALPGFHCGSYHWGKHTACEFLLKRKKKRKHLNTPVQQFPSQRFSTPQLKSMHKKINQGIRRFEAGSVQRFLVLLLTFSESSHTRWSLGGDGSDCRTDPCEKEQKDSHVVR